jgi:hypothetical protein
MIAALFCVSRSSAAGQHELSPPGLADGPGIWANVWNYPAGDVDAYCSNLRSYGIRNLFIQTTRSNMPPIAHAPELGALIDACHRHKIRVIGWAYIDLTDPAGDADKLLAAAHFQSPSGESLDAIAPDMEKNLTIAHIQQLSAKLRESLGPNYPLVAVVYSPLNHYKEVMHIPWKTLAQYFDVIAPMSYWNSKSQKLGAYDYTLATLRIIRQACERPDLEIHAIGDGMGTTGTAIAEFMKACHQAEATSASIYPNQRPTAEQLASLSRYPEFFEPNARFRLAAFREMLKTGVITSSANVDPCQPVSRAEFCRMVARRAHLQAPGADANGGEAPIYSHEALTMLAHLVDNHAKNAKKRGDRWFAAPAMAEAPTQHAQNDRPLNYLDASMMILQASSALR